MTAIRNLEMSGRVSRTIFCCVLWLSVLLHFFSCAYGLSSVRNHYLSCVQFSAFAGISLILWRKNFRFPPWIYALFLLHCAVKQNLFFHLAYSNAPLRVSNARRPKRYKRPYVGNLAFGGRGPPYVVRGYRIFDSTLGYPGEG